MLIARIQPPQDPAKLPSPPAPRAPAEERIASVDGAKAGQSWEGWGATDLFNFDGMAVEEEACKPGPLSREARMAILKLY